MDCVAINKCVPKTGANCADVRPKPLSMFKGKQEQKLDLVKRCTALGTRIGRKMHCAQQKQIGVSRRRQV